MFVQKQLKNLFDNYISGFPKNNLSEPQWVTGFWENKIVTTYDIDGAKIRIDIMYQHITNEFEIKKFEGEFKSVYVTAMKKEGSDSAEQVIKKIYGELVLTKEIVQEIVKEAEEEKKEDIKEEKEKEKESKSDEMEFMDSQKEEMGKGGKIKKK